MEGTFQHFTYPSSFQLGGGERIQCQRRLVVIVHSANRQHSTAGATQVLAITMHVFVVAPGSQQHGTGRRMMMTLQRLSAQRFLWGIDVVLDAHFQEGGHRRVPSSLPDFDQTRTQISETFHAISEIRRQLWTCLTRTFHHLSNTCDGTPPSQSPKINQRRKMLGTLLPSDVTGRSWPWGRCVPVTSDGRPFLGHVNVAQEHDRKKRTGGSCLNTSFH